MHPYVLFLIVHYKNSHTTESQSSHGKKQQVICIIFEREDAMESIQLYSAL